ncbi:hypothetical protein BH11ARM2_BH11ARM2_35950 [soil metagenome]
MIAILATVVVSTIPSAAPWHPETYRALAQAAAFRAKGQLSAEAALLEGVRLGRTRVAVEGNDPLLARALDEGIAIWRAVLPDAPFVASSDGTAEVKLRFVDSVDGPDGMGKVEARRRYWYGKGHGAKLSGTILVRRTVGARPIRESEASAVIAHELGHLLGLDDVATPGPIMGPFVPGDPAEAPTKAEVASVKRLREFCRTDR